jgi:O-antigen ligase
MALGPAIGLALGERGWLKWLGAAACPVLVIGVVISGSRAGLLGTAAVVMIMLMVTRQRNLVIGFGVGAIVAAALLLTNALPFSSGNAIARVFGGDATVRSTDVGVSDAERLGRLREALDLGLSRPLTGVGFEVARDSHSIYLQIWLSAGVIGLIGLVVVMRATLSPLFSVMRSPRDQIERSDQLLLWGLSASFGGYLATGLFHNAIWDRFIWTLPALIIAQRTLRAGQASWSRRTEDAVAPQRIPAGFVVQRKFL